MASFLPTLTAEFHRLSHSTDGRRRLRRWAVAFPALAGIRDLEGVLARRSQDPTAAPAVLSALAALAPTDELAARTLLHALLPGLVHLARTAGHDDPQALEDMVSLAWERIRTYPSDRPGRVAANVLWDVRKRYRRHRRIDAPLSLPLPPSAEASVRSAEDEALDLVSLKEVVAVYRRGVISEAAYRLIVRTRFSGVPIGEIAREQNVSTHVLAQRRYLAERRLLSEMPLAG